MRKVKHTQTTWHEKLSTILDDFPKVCLGSLTASEWVKACNGLLEWVGTEVVIHQHACGFLEHCSGVCSPHPRAGQVDDIHPFYSDLLNVLYDKVKFL